MKNIFIGIFTLFFMSCHAQETTKKEIMENEKDDKIVLTENEWKEKLTPMEFEVLRNKGTERAFTGEYEKHYKNGTYYCAGCNNPLFSSKTKYDSGSGWPAFYDVIDKSNIKEVRDTSHGMYRVEVRCAKCDGHLGHVFEDGPRDKTGMRYCINSVSLDFENSSEKK